MTTFEAGTKLRGVSAALLLALFAVAPAAATKYASIVVDAQTAEVLYERNADEQRYPASLTKVMTLYLVFDALDSGELKLGERMKVSRAASRAAPSKLGLKAGTTIRVEDAIRGLVTKSANDVAIVFAERLAGSEKAFAAKMTTKAQTLGLEHTRFVNASGLPNARQVTTARDMARLAEAVLRDHRTHYAHFSTPKFVWARRTHKNHNTLLRSVEGVDGIKTGYTDASGYNLMASAERDGRRVIAIMMGGTTGQSRDAHVTDLIEAAFLEFEGKEGEPKANLMARIAAGERFLNAADELAAAQLRKFIAADAAAAAARTAPEEPVDGYSTDEGEDSEDVTTMEVAQNNAASEGGSVEDASGEEAPLQFAENADSYTADPSLAAPSEEATASTLPVAPLPASAIAAPVLSVSSDEPTLEQLAQAAARQRASELQQELGSSPQANAGSATR